MLYFGTETMVVALRQVGTIDCSNERLRVVIKTFANWSVNALSTLPGT